MPPRHVVVDGSNLATEGRSLPSLAQLDEAVRAYKQEWPDHDVLVVVDASFSYRIDESEREVFEGAANAGEVVSPPAGAIGRGDGFLLRIADRTDAVVLSNDSFQEFHGEYAWLFDQGRLVGGKPVPGVGWIFTPRSPVRGPKSRESVRDAKTRRRAPRAEPVAQAIAEATAEAVSPEPEARSARRSGRRRGRAPEEAQPEAINEPLPFITFIAEHRLGTEVEGTVDSFTSHGAFVVADGARCYAPMVGLGDPPPRSAKDVLTRGESRTFVVQALDPPRRGIELALPGLARVAGAPTEETVEAEIDEAAHPSRRRSGARAAPPETVDQVLFDELKPLKPPPPPRGGRKRAAAPEPEPVAATSEVQPAPVAGPEPVAAVAGPRRNTSRRAPAAAQAASPVGEEAPPARKARTRKAVAPPVEVEPAEAGPPVARKAAPKAAARKAPAPAPSAVETTVAEAAVVDRAAPTEPPAKAAKAAKAAKGRARKAPVAVEPAPVEPAQPVAPSAPAVSVKKAAARKVPATAAAAKKAPATKAAAAKKVAAKKAPAEKATPRKAAKKAAPVPTG